MSFSVSNAGGYGNGSLSAITISSNQVLNSYAQVTSLTSNTITIGSTSGAISQNSEILFHVSASSNSSAVEYLGKWGVATVSGLSGSTLTVSKNLTNVIPQNQLQNYRCQVVSIPNYTTLTLPVSTTIAPIPFDGEKGGIVAFKCSDTFNLNGGSIDLTDKGISTENSTLRPLLEHEANGTLDADKYAGWENSITKDRLLLNVGDGAAFIIAKKIARNNSSSKIGHPYKNGVQFCRGATDSVDLPSEVTNIGGSTILIATSTFQNFGANLIAKYRSSTSAVGKGLCRCYIATTSKLRNDEGLYAYDTIANKSRAATFFNIQSFGDGSAGATVSPTKQLNNYAILSVDRRYNTARKLRVTAITDEGEYKFEPGALVMIHITDKGTGDALSGRFCFAKITRVEVVSESYRALEFDRDVKAEILNASPTEYNIQLITVPQYTNFTLVSEYSNVMEYNGQQGGIFAIAVSDTCDLRGGKILVEGKGGAEPYGETGLKTIGNAQMSTKLPIGQGHGSIFILAKNLIMDADTRIGASYSGSAYGGETFDNNNVHGNGGGYAGTVIQNSGIVTVASGKQGGFFDGTTKSHFGGYGSNGAMEQYGRQGAHIMIIANTITGFNQAAISTGGEGGIPNTAGNSTVSNGGAGYGGGGKVNSQYGCGGAYNAGGGGFNGSASKYGGGGSSGWAFIYCNNAVNQDITDTIVD